MLSELENNRKKTLSILSLSSAGIIWGGSFVVTKDSLDYLSPLWQLALRLLVAAVPAMILAWIYRKKWTKRTLFRSIFLGFAFWAALTTQNIGMASVSASKTGFLTTTYVAFVPCIYVLVLKRKVANSQIVAAFICMIGAFLLSYDNSFVIGSGDLWVLACGFFYAVHIIIADMFREEDGVLLHIGQVLTAAILSVILAFMTETMPAQLNMHVILCLLYCGLLEVFLCFFLQIIGQKNTPVSLASILLSMESVYSAIFAYIFLHERMGFIMWIGCGLIFLAAIVSNKA